MQADETQFLRLRFSTRDLPERERVPFWREVLGREVCHIDIEPQPDGPFEAEADMLALPGLGVGWCRSATPARWSRTPDLVKDGDDAFALLMTVGGAVTRSQRGRDLDVQTGDGVGILHNEPATMRFQALQHMAVMVPRAALSLSVTDLEQASTRLVPSDSQPLRLLRSYLTALRETLDVGDPALGSLVATHVYDLVALAIGATKDGREIALRRGLRAARLRAIKADLAANPALTLSALAARQRVTPRYVQMLFEADGTTFTAYALDLRLQRAHAMLTDARHADWTIGAIAYSAGFGDLSYFNRSFKRRYGASPSEVRAELRPKVKD